MQALTGLFSGGQAPVNLLAAPSTGMATGSGLNLSSILQGTATVGGILSILQAGSADAQAAELKASDAEREIPFETLQGIARRRDLKRAAAEQIGDLTVAYAASGVDVSEGSAAEARKQTFRELDLGLATDEATQEIRQSRLKQRAGIYRLMRRQLKRKSYADAFAAAFGTGRSLAGQAGLT